MKQHWIGRLAPALAASTSAAPAACDRVESPYRFARYLGR
jgi:hypothetical protein